MARSAFGKKTTGTQVAETFRDRIRGRTVLVTGPSPRSIGEATALAIARQAPALLILAGRTPVKLDAVAASCREVVEAAAAGNGQPAQGNSSSNVGTGTNVRIVVVDLASQVSVRAAASQVAGLTNHLDVLINNAGIGPYPREYSPEGIERTFATNHLGHFLLTTLLLPLLGPSARVINVSSSAHQLSPVRFSDINFDDEADGPRKGRMAVPKEEQARPNLPAWVVERTPDGFPGMIAYGMSKSANILFTVGLKRRLASKGADSFALHPGEIKTNIVNEAPTAFAKEISRLPAENWKDADQGCATTLVAAFDPELPGSNHIYLQDCQIARPARWASDPEKAERLWRLSEDLVAGSSTPVGSKL